MWFYYELTLIYVQSSFKCHVLFLLGMPGLGHLLILNETKKNLSDKWSIGPFYRLLQIFTTLRASCNNFWAIFIDFYDSFPGWLALTGSIRGSAKPQADAFASRLTSLLFWSLQALKGKKKFKQSFPGDDRFVSQTQFFRLLIRVF